uniref:Acetyl-coenzyme A transporter 1 n=1 Tax=Wuchereria bancrofti TaxID=6293 RepID=A0A1I8ES88_WUCBA
MAEEMLFGHRNETFEYMDEKTDDTVTTESGFITPTRVPYTRYRLKRHNCKLNTEGISKSGDEEVDKMKKLDESPSEDLPLSWLGRVRKSFQGDFGSLCLLTFLYLLQGIPLGLIAAIPLVLSSKHVSYGQQAIFSFAHWPFSVKLLWAPIVDSVYWRRIGRRKSWMVPCQYLIGIFMLLLSYRVSEIMGDSGADSKPPNVFLLMFLFLPLNFLAATQDIAVDGWALTMLSKENVGHASTCNAAGQTAGFFLGNVMFLTLDSPDFANRFFRNKPEPFGLVNLSGFIFFWGWVFLITTTLVLIFKEEVDHSVIDKDDADNKNEELELGIFQTYAVLWKILRLKPVMWMVIVLLTGKFAFAATDGITGLKLISMGMPKDKLSSIALFLVPLQVLLPWVVGKYIAGPRPLNIFLLAYPYRIFLSGVFATMVWCTPSLSSKDFPTLLYAVWIVAYCFHQVASYSMFVSLMAFFAQVSDPTIGGTYMTLLNTLSNLGGNWPVTLILSLTDHFTFKNCVVKGTKTILGSCNTEVSMNQCTAEGNVCELAVDGKLDIFKKYHAKIGESKKEMNKTYYVRWVDNDYEQLTESCRFGPTDGPKSSFSASQSFENAEFQESSEVELEMNRYYGLTEVDCSLKDAIVRMIYAQKVLNKVTLVTAEFCRLLQDFLRNIGEMQMKLKALLSPFANIEQFSTDLLPITNTNHSTGILSATSCTHTIGLNLRRCPMDKFSLQE